MRKLIISTLIAGIIGAGINANAATTGPSHFDRRENDPSRYTVIILGSRCIYEDDLAEMYLRSINDGVVTIGCRNH